MVGSGTGSSRTGGAREGGQPSPGPKPTGTSCMESVCGCDIHHARRYFGSGFYLAFVDISKRILTGRGRAF